MKKQIIDTEREGTKENQASKNRDGLQRQRRKCGDGSNAQAKQAPR
jgi:hypothetical protein